MRTDAVVLELVGVERLVVLALGQSLLLVKRLALHYECSRSSQTRGFREESW